MKIYNTVQAILVAFFCLVPPISCKPRMENIEEIKDYYLGEYLISPQTKEIKKRTMVGGINWDGYTYIADTSIEYDTTKLYLIGDAILFEEHLKGIDGEQLKVLDGETFRNNLQFTLTYGDSIYETSYASLRSVAPYSLKEHNKLTSDESKENVLKAGKSFTAYQDSVILKKGYKTVQLDLNPNKVQEYLIDNYYQTYIITDGNTVYLHSLFYQGTQLKELDYLQNKKVEIVTEVPHGWRIHQGNKAMYMSLIEIQEEKIKLPPRTLGSSGLLISAIDGYYIVNRDGYYKKANYFYIPNMEDTALEKYEPETMQHRIKVLNSTSYILNSKLYKYKHLVRAEDQERICLDKLYRIESKAVKTEFYTDGNVLVDLDETTGYSTSNNELILEHRITDKIDIASLKIVNSNTLIDKNNIYHKMYDRIEVIPLDILNIPVIVISTEGIEEIIKRELF